MLVLKEGKKVSVNHCIYIVERFEWRMDKQCYYVELQSACSDSSVSPKVIMYVDKHGKKVESIKGICGDIYDYENFESNSCDTKTPRKKSKQMLTALDILRGDF